jgi:hypothetical protein
MGQVFLVHARLNKRFSFISGAYYVPELLLRHSEGQPIHDESFLELEAYCLELGGFEIIISLKAKQLHHRHHDHTAV